MDYTLRQLVLYYRECLRIDNARTAAGIVSANLGFTGGQTAQQAVDRLLERWDG
jgi:hypothetical protein